MTLTVGSLFSGIGGLDLGLERAGMIVRWQAEVDPYCSRVLAKHWPHVPNLGDVTTVDWETVERVDLICGGYPCQPFSYAGTRQGTDDARHLWPHFAESLRVLRPRYALLENVPGHLSLGFGEVLGDLAELGYDTEWECIPAAAVGAPHLRYRVFVVAYTNRKSEPGEPVDAFTRPRELVPDTNRAELWDQPKSLGRSGGTPVARDDGTVGNVADADGPVGRPPGSAGEAIHEPETVERLGRRSRILGDTFGASADSLAAYRRSWGPASKSGWWAVEPDVGRVAYGVPARVDRLRSLGNAVVPQVAEWVGRQLIGAL